VPIIIGVNVIPVILDGLKQGGAGAGGQCVLVLNENGFNMGTACGQGMKGYRANAVDMR
jgi:hypothetical protein|tara:strand:+ start:605 stop:781 length:177 start_codon:yes stop_codon:yes gene_type:complete